MRNFLKDWQWRRADIESSHTECAGSAPFVTNQGEWAFKARADRIDFLKDGSAHIIDYKTGGRPKVSQLESGQVPQLFIEAAILAAGGYRELPRVGLEKIRLSYQGFRGKPDYDAHWWPAKISPIRDVLEKLTETMARFSSADQAYEALAEGDPDYQHLARWQGLLAEGAAHETE